MNSPSTTQEGVDNQLHTNLKFADFATTSTQTDLIINCKYGQMVVHSPIYTFFNLLNIQLSEPVYSEDMYENSEKGDRARLREIQKKCFTAGKRSLEKIS